MPHLFGISRKKQESDDLKLEERGLRWLEKVARAPHQESWSVTIIQYAWTAGPVSLLAAAGGWYLSYGTSMPTEKALYFVGYSIIAIILGLITKLTYNMTHGRKLEKDRTSLLDTIDRIPEIIYIVRDLVQRNLSEESRRIHSAGILLRKLDLGPEWVATAIEDLTGDKELAKQAEKIEIFRRAGLYNRMRDVVENAKKRTEDAYQQLKEHHPRTAEAMRQRMNGIVTTPHHGQKRETLFIERILTAIEQDNEELMTLHDVEEMLTLCFELICGREIAYLKIEYTGHWDLAKALDKLEEERNDYRISRARVYSRLKALTNYLNNTGINTQIVSAQGISANKLLSTTVSAMDELSRQVRDARQLTSRTDKHTMALNIKAQQLDKALQLYNESHRAYLKQGRDSQRLKRALKQWQSRSNTLQSKQNESLKRSLTISEQIISLDDEARVAVARRLNRFLEESRLRRDSLRQDDPLPIAEKDLTATRAREVAIEVSTILDPYIELHDPQIQRAIENANASSLASLEPGMSAKTKAALGEAMASAVEKNLAASAERLAQNLIRYYRVPLSEKTIHFLTQTYNASRERLEFIAQYETPLSANYSLDNVSLIEVPPAKNSWQIDLYNARRLISRYNIKGAFNS
ncbi:hypothetical protein [Endozoicomonas sp. Mp262]|uniref:hypothetical protein n=1 Tax=Endozoicomonas sp. Mp262 TaxID=2919499 RepID=UPI0021DAFD48